jgi:hypothetical protein
MKKEKRTWYTVKDGLIDRVQILRDGEKPLPENLNWILSPTNNILHSETPIERYDTNMRYLSDEEWLKKQGKKDNRGRWYHKEKIGEILLIYGIDETIDENEYTKEAPIENEPYQKFDNKKKKWVIDTEKKARAEKEMKLGRLKSEIAEVERKRLRSKFAIDDNEATEKDFEFNAKYKAQIEALRPQITALENELKSA